jgi:hypothetical protein
MKFPHLLLVAVVAIGVGLFYLSSVTSATDTPPPKTIKAAEQILKLNGSAIRTVFGIKVYQVGLYVIKPSKDENVIFGDRDKKRIQIKMLREVKGKKFESTIRKNIAKNFSPAEKDKFSKQNERFLECFVSKIMADETVVDIDFLPGEGTEVLLDGKRIDLIPGDDYYHALLRLWIGEPLQESIKHGLMGKAKI